MILVGTLMPALMVMGDRILMNNELEMIRQYLKRRAERRKERAKALLQRARRKKNEEGKSDVV